MIRNLKRISKNELGFTLIEVMVVIIMVGILAAIAVPIYTNYVYRARASEAVSTLGAVKTYLMERRNATGAWPTENEMLGEFHNFNELYYFNTPSIAISDPNTITIVITPSDKFDAPTGYEDANLSLIIDWKDAKNGGWKGAIRSKWASHLKEPGE